MSATIRRLEFGVTVEDPEHWTAKHKTAADADTTASGYDDWVVARLAEVMHEAGQDFIENHPDLFRGELT